MIPERLRAERRLEAMLEAQPDGAPRMTRRPYQFDVAYRVERSLRAGRNVVVDLPTNAGKTMVANLVSGLWLTRQNRKHSRCVLLVPTRSLVSQHHSHSAWLQPTIAVAAIVDDDGSSAVRMRRKWDLGRCIISTPGIVASAASKGWITRDQVESVDLVIIDEFDALLTTEFTNAGPATRAHESLKAFMVEFGENPTALLSATPPSPSGADELDGAAVEFVSTSFNPISVSASMRSIGRYLPKTRIEPEPLLDLEVEEFDLAIRNEMSTAVASVIAELSGMVDGNEVLRSARGIAKGTATSMRLITGAHVRVTPSVRRHCHTLQRQMQYRLMLFEDLFQGASVYEGRWARWDDERHDLVWSEGLRLFVPEMGAAGMQPSLRAKADAVVFAAVEYADEQLVVMTRYVRTAAALADRLEQESVDAVLLHGQLTDSERANSRMAFRRREVQVLLMTRRTGGRGLDLPESDRLVFYSPKEHEGTMFQETSRIRSTSDHLKTAAILYYVETAEEEKLATLINAMGHRRNRYEFASEAEQLLRR